MTSALALALAGCTTDQAIELDREHAALGAADEDESAGPLAKVAFPPPQSATSNATIRVRGTARTNAGIVSIEANGVAAQTSDGFASWMVEVPLELGYNTVEVVATVQKPNGKTKTKKVAELSVGRELDLQWPQSLALDGERNRVLIMDTSGRALYSADLDTGEGRLISSAARGAGPALTTPRSVALDAAHDRALITDHSHGGVVAVDLETGDRTLLTGLGAGAGPAFVYPYRIAVDDEGDRAYVTDPVLNAVFAVELDSGERSVLTGSATGAGPVLGEPLGVALDAPAQRLLVTDATLQAVVGVDLATGDRAIVSDSYCSWCLSNPLDIVVDQANDRAVVLNFQHGYQITFMDLESGAMGSVAQSNVGHGSFFEHALALALDEAHDRILLASPQMRSIMAVHPPPPGLDLSHSLKLNFTRLAVGEGPRPVVVLDGLPWNPRKTLMFEFARRGLLMFDALTGQRRAATELSPPILFPAGLERDGEDRVIIGERLDDCAIIYSFELESGQGTAIGGGEPCIEEMTDLVNDPARNQVLLLTEEGSLYAFDRATGTRTMIAGEDVGSGPELAESIMAELDAARGRVLVSDEEYDGLLSVDLATGDRELIFDNVVVPPPSGDDSSSDEDDPIHLELIAMDVARDEVVAVNRSNGLIFALELATGSYRLVTGSYKGRGPRLSYVLTVFLDTERDLIMVHDLQLGGLVAVDRVTGDRVIAAR